MKDIYKSASNYKIKDRTIVISKVISYYSTEIRKSEISEVLPIQTSVDEHICIRKHARSDDPLSNDHCTQNRIVFLRISKNESAYDLMATRSERRLYSRTKI